MRLFGLEITRAKAITPTVPSSWGSSSWGGGWWPVIREPFTGAWQRNLEERPANILAHSAVFACVTLISSDIAKLPLDLMQRDADGIWQEIDSNAFSPVLRRPNRYQNRIKFVEQWITSKLIHGNTYVLKERDARGLVVAMYVLDPTRTKVVVSEDGSIYYQLYSDNLSGIVEDEYYVPQSEIIHDTMVCLYHPLCGVSPITACALAAAQGLAIQRNSTNLFTNGVRPGGIITAPTEISDEHAARIKEFWESNYSGGNAGRIAVLGDAMKFESVGINAVDSQLIEQLKWSAETICSVFHVPPYMIGAMPPPNYNNIEALNQQYYSQCLQSIIMNLQLCLNEGLGLTAIVGKTYGTRFDLDDLLRMDTATLYKTVGDGVNAAILTPNEGRLRLNKPPLKGGDTVYMQQQDVSLEAAAAASQDIINPPSPPPSAAPAAPAAPALPLPDDTDEDGDKSIDLMAITAFAAWEAKAQLRAATS
jgi:HK97 family phage portal protein